MVWRTISYYAYWLLWLKAASKSILSIICSLLGASLSLSVFAFFFFSLEFSIYFEKTAKATRKYQSRMEQKDEPSVVWLNTVGKPNHIANPLAMAKQNATFFSTELRIENESKEKERKQAYLLWEHRILYQFYRGRADGVVGNSRGGRGWKKNE